MSKKIVKKDQTTVAACREACPAGIDVPRYVRAIKTGDFDLALAVIRERIPFPSVCGYACYSPCEMKCGNRQFGDPIAIRALKRAAAEKGGDLWKKSLKIAPATGKKVAVVGSGPSGLSTAYYLATLGHAVTVFEQGPKLGGMMRQGIPEYRLPRDGLDAEIGVLADLGVKCVTDHKVESVDALLKDGFQAVYVACGAQKGARLGCPGDEFVTDGIAFLRAVNNGQDFPLGKKVAIIGGGNTAVDASRCAIRLEAQKVSVFYRRTAEQMTAYEEEVGAAMAEGVKVKFLTAPVSVEKKGNKFVVTFIRMELGKPDKSGRPAPVPVKGSEFTKKFDTVIAAVGQALDVPASFGVALTEKNAVAADAATLSASAGKPGVFAGGDCVTGPASIIQAIAAGRKAAASIDKFLGGKGAIDQPLAPPEVDVVVMDFQQKGESRVAMPCIPLSNRTCGFAPVEVGYSSDAAVKEAWRCLGCDARQFEPVVFAEACKECGYCVEVCGLGVFEKGEKFNAKGFRPYTAAHPEKCVGCNLCFYSCPDFAIEVKEA